MASGKYSAAADFLANFAARQQKLRTKQLAGGNVDEDIPVKPAPPPGIPPKHAIQIQGRYKAPNDSGISIESLSAPCLEERHTALLHQLKKMKAMIAFGEKERQQLLFERMKLLTEYQVLEQKYRQSIAYINRNNLRTEVHQETMPVAASENEEAARSNLEQFTEREEYLIKTVANLQHALKKCVERLKSSGSSEGINCEKTKDDKLNRKREKQMNTQNEHYQTHQRSYSKAKTSKGDHNKANQNNLKQQQTNQYQILAERDALFRYARHIESELAQEKEKRKLSRFIYHLEKARLLRMQKALSHWKLLFRFNMEQK